MFGPPGSSATAPHLNDEYFLLNILFIHCSFTSSTSGDTVHNPMQSVTNHDNLSFYGTASTRTRMVRLLPWRFSGGVGILAGCGARWCRLQRKQGEFLFFDCAEQVYSLIVVGFHAARKASLTLWLSIGREVSLPINASKGS